jgi:hypothetical protein
VDDEKIIDLRVQGIKEASTRARVAFFIMVFACGTIIVTLYNNYFMWNRIFLDPARGLVEWPSPRDTAAGVQDPAPPSGLTGAALEGWKQKLTESKRKRLELSERLGEELRKQDMHNLSDNEGISISLLGIKMSSGDLDIFGTAALLLISMYYLLCVRRMGLEMGSLFRDIARSDALARRYVYMGVRQSYVLNAAADERTGNPEFGNLRIDNAIAVSSWLFQNMTFLPTVTIATMIAMDWYFLFVRASGFWWLTHLSPEYRYQFLLMNTFAMVVGYVTFLLNRGTSDLQQKAVAHLATFLSELDRPVQPVLEKGARA